MRDSQIPTIEAGIPLHCSDCHSLKSGAVADRMGSSVLKMEAENAA